MEPSCVRQTAIPGTTRLFDDYLYQFDQVRSFYPSHFSDPQAIPETLQKLEYPESRRSALVSALREQNGDSAALEKLAQPGTVAVVTGQQVGLFSGPAYTIFKAVTAAKLAMQLNEQGIPAVAVFWLATEDHDLAEADHAWVFNHELSPAKIAVAPGIVNGGPVGEVKIGEAPISELRDGLGHLPFAEDVVQRIERAYPHDSTFGSGFRSLLQEVLKDFDLLYLDPLTPAIREIAAPFLSKAAGEIADLTAALRERNRNLLAAGYHSQVHIDEDTSLLFLIDNGKRMALRWKADGFATRDRSYTRAQLEQVADRLSPNALLRPVMQDYLLPTLCYVGGPSEIAYLAQGEVLYKRLLGRMPVIFPRNSFTLLDTRAAKLLTRYRLQIADMLGPQEKVRSCIASKLVPRKLDHEFASLRSGMSSSLAKLQTELTEFDATLEAAVNKSASKILYQLDKLSRKTARETMRRDQRAHGDATYLMNLIYPERHLQERFYSIIPFLAKHGLDLPQQLLGQTQLVCPDHMVRTF